MLLTSIGLTRPYKVNRKQTWGKRGPQDPGVVLYFFYVQLHPINLISSIN